MPGGMAKEPYIVHLGRTRSTPIAFRPNFPHYVDQGRVASVSRHFGERPAEALSADHTCFLTAPLLSVDAQRAGNVLGHRQMLL